MLKIRRPHDRLIFKMGIAISGKEGLYIEMGPRVLSQYQDGLSRYRDSYHKDEIVVRPSYLYDGNLYTSKLVPL